MPIQYGSTYATFFVRLRAAASVEVAVHWYTEPGTAVPGEDYEHAMGDLVFAPGQTMKPVQVLVYGRAPGDDEERDFKLRVVPGPGVLMVQSAATCTIKVTTSEDVPVTEVIVATGPVGMSAYDLAVLQGFVGTAEQWIDSLKGEQGDEVEMRVTGTHIQWKLVPSPTWIDLIALSALTGPAGPTGPAGAAGALWHSGSAAPTTEGGNGDYYLRTTNGDVYGPKTAGAWGSPILNLMGPAGPAGALWHTGTGAPSNGTGADGDFYLRSTTGDYYGPKAAGAWGSIAGNLKGPQGDAGGAAVQQLLTADATGTTSDIPSVIASVTLTANKVYAIRSTMIYRVTDTAKGIKVAVGGTAGIQSLAVAFTGFDSAGAPVIKYTKTKDQNLTFATSAVNGDDNLMNITGLVYCTGGGTLTLKLGSAVEFDYSQAQKGTFWRLEEIGTITP